MRHIAFQLALVALLAIGTLVVMNRFAQAKTAIPCSECVYVRTTQQTWCRCRFQNEVKCSLTQWNYDHIRDVDTYDCNGSIYYYCHPWRANGCCTWGCSDDPPECPTPNCT
jgi:hypothetical protein